MPLRFADMAREQPVRIDQLGRLAADQRHAADFARTFGMDDVMLDRGEIHDFLEGVGESPASRR